MYRRLDNSSAAITALTTRVTALEGKVPIPLVTALPGTPANGQEVYYHDTTHELVWHFRYNSALLQWQAVGEQTAIEVFDSVGSTVAGAAFSSYGGGVLSLPLGGIYDVSWGFVAVPTNATVSGAVIKLAATNLGDVSTGVAAGTTQDSPAIERRMTGFNSGDNIQLQYAILAGAGTALVENRVLRMKPVQVF